MEKILNRSDPEDPPNLSPITTLLEVFGDTFAFLNSLGFCLILAHPDLSPDHLTRGLW